MGDATGLASDICDIFEMSELVVEVLKAVRAHVVRGLRAMGAARSSERVACENMVDVFAGQMLDKALSMSLTLVLCRRRRHHEKLPNFCQRSAALADRFGTLSASSLRLG